MRTTTTAGLAVALGACLLAPVALLGARSDGGPPVETIHVVGETTELAEIDIGAPGPSLGDVIAFSERLVRGGRALGDYRGVCTLTGDGGRYHCQATAALADGHIAFQGLLDFPSALQGVPFPIPITGGTGRYRDARGQMRVRFLNEKDVDRVIVVRR